VSQYNENQIRVLELRASCNGWVITLFQREAASHVADMAIYRTYVAETGETAAKLVKALLESESWDMAVGIPPARGKL